MENQREELEKAEESQEQPCKDTKWIDLTRLERGKSSRRALGSAAFRGKTPPKDVSLGAETCGGKGAIPSPLKPAEEPEVTRDIAENALLREAVRLRKKIADSEVDYSFLNRFSFGPVCGVYLANPALWYFLIPPLTASLLLIFAQAPFWFVLLGTILLALNPLHALTLCVVLAWIEYDAPWQISGSLEKIAGPNGVIAIIYALVLFIVLISVCIFARRLRWAYLSWSSFTEFREIELRWQIVGIALFALMVFLLVGIFLLAIQEDVFMYSFGFEFK